MLRVFKHLEAGCLQVNLMSTSAEINHLIYTILYHYLQRSYEISKINKQTI